MRFLGYALAIGMCFACTSCSSADAGRAPSAARAPLACSNLYATWSEVEPIDGTTAYDEPDEDKVRRMDAGALLAIEPGRMTITRSAERLDTRISVEQLSDGSCMLHARDSLGKPADIAVTFSSERLMRLRNIAEPKSAGTLYERR